MNKLTITAAAPCDEINMKLAKAIAICTVTRLARDILDKDSRIVDALWAATELLDEAKEAFTELSRTAIGFE